MPDPTYLFLDFDDTLSDFEALGAMYVRELAALLAGDFGGEEAAWAAAVQPELAASKARYVEKFAGDPLAGFNAWIGPERARVAEAVFARVGRPFPTDDPPDVLAARLQFDA